jgi:hypothetical protein
MRLLLTRHVDQYRIDVRREGLIARRAADGLGTDSREPLTDEVTVKTIMLDHQHAPHLTTPS